MKTILMTIISIIAFSLSSYGQFDDGLGGEGQSPYADLTIDNITVYTPPGNANPASTFTITIRNSVDAGAISGENVVRLRISTSTPGVLANYAYVTVPHISPGGTATVTVMSHIPYTNNYIRVSGWVDYKNDVIEFNEENNGKTIYL